MDFLFNETVQVVIGVAVLAFVAWKYWNKKKTP